MVDTVPRSLADWMFPFFSGFTGSTWKHVLVLVAGALLSPGRRPVTAALRVMDLDQTASFSVYHRVLSTASWSARLVAHRLLRLLVAAFVREGPVVIGLDDTIERRWGATIKARGIYRDPVRSSHGHFVKVSGLRWLCVLLLTPIPGANCVWALPFLTVLAPSERDAQSPGRRHKKLTDWGRQALLQTSRWLPDRRIVAVADSSFSVIEVLRSVKAHLDVVTRRRLDAGLYQPPRPRRPGDKGRPRVKGARLPTLHERVADPATAWQRVVIQGWYGRTQHRLDVATGPALWHHPGRRGLIRWVLVRDAEGTKEPQAFLCTDLDAEPTEILAWFVRRWRVGWRVEVTLSEVRRHLGVETQRQWSDLAILRTTPALLGLFSLVTLWADRIKGEPGIPLDHVRWYPKADPTFSDALALVRFNLSTSPTFATSPDHRDSAKNTNRLLNRLIRVACKPP